VLISPSWLLAWGCIVSCKRLLKIRGTSTLRNNSIFEIPNVSSREFWTALSPWSITGSKSNLVLCQNILILDKKPFIELRSNEDLGRNEIPFRKRRTYKGLALSRLGKSFDISAAIFLPPSDLDAPSSYFEFVA
jgi:hypothetical protein